PELPPMWPGPAVVQLCRGKCMPQPTPDQVQIANEVLAGTRQITASSPAEDTEAKAAEEASRNEVEASIEQQQATAMDAHYGPASPGTDAPAIEPAPEPQQAPDISPEPE